MQFTFVQSGVFLKWPSKQGSHAEMQELQMKSEELVVSLVTDNYQEQLRQTILLYLLLAFKKWPQLWVTIRGISNIGMLVPQSKSSFHIPPASWAPTLPLASFSVNNIEYWNVGWKSIPSFASKTIYLYAWEIMNPIPLTLEIRLSFFKCIEI